VGDLDRNSLRRSLRRHARTDCCAHRGDDRSRGDRKRFQSGEVDYVGGISKCGDRRVRTLLYEAANVMLTRYKGQLKLKDWAFAIARRSTMRKARVALARRLAIIMHAMLRDGTAFISA
jgi:transposase